MHFFGKISDIRNLASLLARLARQGAANSRTFAVCSFLEEKTTLSTHARKIHFTQESQPIFALALVVLSLKGNILSAGQMEKMHKVLFTQKVVYLQTKSDSEYYAEMLGRRG